MDLSPLIRAGFSRRQSKVLSESLAGGSDPAEVLMLGKSSDIPDQVPEWDSGFGPSADGIYRSSSALWLDVSVVERQAGSAISWDPDEGITYTQDGVYINYLYLQFLPAAGFDNARVGPGKFVVSDAQFLTAVGETNTGFDFFQVTWMAVQSAGDTNTSPHLDVFQAHNPYGVHQVRYTTVKLVAA